MVQNRKKVYKALVSKVYKVGTRGSLLARTQARQVLDQLSKINPALSLELKVIKTAGDADTSKPLWQMDGKDFFTRELDSALLAKEVDLVVHSYKDLGSQRPDKIVMGAISRRQYGQDILLIKDHTIEQLKNGSLKKLRVGTSSPRRVVNIKNSLASYIPMDSSSAVETMPLRGNINTRIEKLRNGEYEAIVIALAGLERLANEVSTAKTLADLVRGINYMVMPTMDFPSAASQGALGIEVLEDCSAELLDAVKKLDHQNTVQEVQREREIFQNYGGGCHLAVGIRVLKRGHYFLHANRGEVDGGKVAEYYLSGERPDCAGRVFIGLPPGKVSSPKDALYDYLVEKTPIEVEKTAETNAGAAVVTSTYCIDALEQLNPNLIVASGAHTHRVLAQKNYWVNICGDGLGEEYIATLLASKALQIIRPANRTWVLTNDESKSSLGPTIPCYKRSVSQERAADSEFARKLEKTQCFYWTSFPQYQIYAEHFPHIRHRQHACGTGKTWDKFKDSSIPVIPFAHMNEFYRWARL